MSHATLVLTEKVDAPDNLKRSQQKADERKPECGRSSQTHHVNVLQNVPTHPSTHIMPIVIPHKEDSQREYDEAGLYGHVDFSCSQIGCHWCVSDLEDILLLVKNKPLAFSARRALTSWNI